jgi:soluble lytic murein transglycosylase-like protein
MTKDIYSSIDPHISFVKPKIETLFEVEQPPPNQLNEILQKAAALDIKEQSDSDFHRKATIKSLDLVSLHALDPKMAKEKMESKDTDIEKEIRIAVEKICKKYKNTDPKLIEAMIIVESKRYYKAVSKERAGGLMQIVPDTAKKLGLVDRFNPVDNMDAGIRYFAYLLKIYNGNVKLALAGYNAGPGRVAEYGGTVPPFKETEEYIIAVLGHYARLKGGRG